jgi:hypothetical protein
MWLDAHIVGFNLDSRSGVSAKRYRATLKRGGEYQIFVVHPNRALLWESQLHLTGADAQRAFLVGLHAVAIKDRGSNNGVHRIQMRAGGLQDNASGSSLRRQRNT